MRLRNEEVEEVLLVYIEVVAVDPFVNVLENVAGMALREAVVLGLTADSGAVSAEVPRADDRSIIIEV